ncbi:hypothetical protein FS749_008463, partial [Ceratobasidium sp. UAMH 11750]
MALRGLNDWGCQFQSTLLRRTCTTGPSHMSYYIDFFRSEPSVGDPLTSVREYTVASQLADSRTGSPEPALNTEEEYDDPVSLGIIPEDAVIGLFYS